MRTYLSAHVFVSVHMCASECTVPVCACMCACPCVCLHAHAFPSLLTAPWLCLSPLAGPGTPLSEILAPPILGPWAGLVFVPFLLP